MLTSSRRKVLNKNGRLFRTAIHHLFLPDRNIALGGKGCDNVRVYMSRAFFLHTPESDRSSFPRLVRVLRVDVGIGASHS